MKTAAQALAKWEASTSLGTNTWLTNLQSTNKPIVDAAIASRSLMQANFNQSTAAGGVWETRLRAVGDAGIKAAAAAKSQNYATGVSQGAAKMGAALQKIIAYEQAGLPALQSLPKGKPRMNAWFDYMSAGRGQLGA